MNTDKIDTLANGLLLLSQATDIPFIPLVERLERAGILDDEEVAAVIEFTGGK